MNIIKDKPLVSVITPSYNSIEWLEKSISSAAKQKGDFDIEIIVVDDQSKDGSLELAIQLEKKIPSLNVYINPNKGANTARSYGFSKSKGEFIQWLDSDDQLLPNKISAQLEAFTENNGADVIYSDWRKDKYRNGTKVNEEVTIEQISDDYLKRLIRDDWQPSLSYLLKREVAQKLHDLGAWNPDRKIAQDREYFTKAAILGFRFAYTPGVFSVYNRWSDQSISSMDFKKRIELNLQLEFELMNWISDSKFSQKRKSELINLLKTQSLKAAFYCRRIRIKSKVAWNEIIWDQIHYKMRLIIPFIWIWQNLLLVLKRASN